MGKTWLLVVFVVCWLQCTSQITVSQEEFDIAHWLDRETVARLQISDVAETFDRLVQLPLFTDPGWKEVAEQIQDPQARIVHPDRLKKLIEVFEEVDYLVDDVKEVNFVIHGLEPLKWTLLVRAEPSVFVKLKKQICLLGACLFDAEKPIDEPLVFDFDGFASELVQRGWGHAFQVGNWFIISTHDEFVAQLQTSQAAEIKDERSLAADRAYQTIKSRSNRFGQEKGVISVYFKPSKAGPFFPAYSEEQWKGMGTQELAAAGLNFVMMPDVEDSEAPTLLADAVVLCTLPKTKRSLLVSFYEPIEVPFLTVKPTQIYGFGRDEKAYFEESCRMFDDMFGEVGTEEAYVTRFANDGRDFFLDALPRRKSYFDIQYFEKKSDVQPRIMRLEKVKELASMRRYVEGMMTESTQFFGRPLAAEHEQGMLVWRLGESAAIKNVGRSELDAEDLTTDNQTMDSYLVGKEWYVEGEWPQTRSQLLHLEDRESLVKDFGEPIRRLVADLLMRAEDENPFQISYREPNSWRLLIARMRARSEWSLPFGSEEGRSRKNLNRLLFTIATRTVRSFGRQLTLHTQDEDEIRVLFGCYPFPKEKPAATDE